MGVPPGLLRNEKGSGAGMRPAIVCGMVSREASVNYWQILQKSTRLSFLLISKMANGFLKVAFRLKENLVPRVRVTLVRRSWERDWLLECSCQTNLGAPGADSRVGTNGATKALPVLENFRGAVSAEPTILPWDS